MIDKINASQVPDVLEKSASQQPDPARARTTNSQPEVSLEVDFPSLVEPAACAAQTDPEAVKQARELLASGELLSADNIRAAAQDIVDHGI